MTLNIFLAAVLGVSLNAVAQLFLKAGTTRFSGIINKESITQIIFSLFRIIFEPHIFCGLSCYVISVGIWIFVLTKSQVSIAYPLLSIGYIINIFLAYYLFSEPITISKIIGITFIVIGVITITR